MRHLSMQIDRRLRKVENWWKLQCFLRRTILLALCVTLFVLALGTLIVTGWITEPGWANGWLAGLMVVSVIAWLIIALVSAGTPKEPDWLAAALEKSHVDLQDRLNTLVYLQHRRDSQSQEISRALERDVHRVLRTTPSGCPFPWRRILRQMLALTAALLFTIAFFRYFQPWDRLQTAAVAQTPEEEIAGLEIPEAPRPSEEQPLGEADKVPWGEIRITEPGRDLKVTRLDLIPLQIEAASNRTLERAEWVTLVSEGPTERHGLPAPEHPNYVVYRPSLIVEDYGLEEWDVMSYYAEAHTREGEVYRSVEYFIEVVPPRPELEQLPEPAYQSLEDITGLIEWQAEVIRETGRLNQLQGLDDEDRKRRHDELAAQERQLQKSARHLAARLESRFGTEPLEGLRGRFESAAFSLQDAQQTLEKQETADSTQNERAALGRLAAARKHFHERVKQDPQAFDISPEDQVTRNLDESRRPLDAEQMRELRQQLEERKQALTDSQDKLQQLIDRQRLVELKTRRAEDALWKELADDEQQLNQELQQLAKQSSEMSEKFQSEAKDAGQTLQKAQEALTAENKPAAEQETAGATERLEQLAETLNSEREQVELAEQMLLEERLRRNREEYAEIEEQAEPRTSEELEETTRETKEIVEELEKIAQQQPPSESPEKNPSDLQQELTPEKREQLAGQCDKMCRQTGAAGQSQTAAEIGQSLEKLSQALQKDIGQKLASQDSPPKQNQQLDRMQATQDQLKQAREAVQKALAEQTDIERSINPRNRQPQPQLSRRQKQNADAFEEAMKQNPQGFARCQSQASGAKNAMQQSERSLQSSNPLARQRASEAAEELRRLDSALEEQQQKNRLADAYRQKQLLDEQIEQLKRFEQNPESVSPSQCQSSGGACKNLTGSMQQLMQQPGMSEAFGPKLQEALNDENKQQIDRQSDALADSKTPEDIKSSSAQLRQNLEELSRAFESGQPNQGLARRPGNSLKPSGQQAIAEGLRRLESESQRNRQGRPIPKQASQQLREDAVAHLAEGLFGEYGYNEQTRAVIMQWREELKDPDFTVDRRVVQQLLRDIQQTRGEAELSEKQPNQKPGVQTIDPSKYPPEYRPLIESYFQKLSERP